MATGQSDIRPGDAFPAPDFEAWQALALKSARAASLAELASATDDGIAIKPLYTAENSAAALAIPPLPERAPAIRSLIAEATLEAANTAIGEEIEGGAEEILLQVEGPGQPGVPVRSQADLDRVLERVDPVSLAVHLRHAVGDGHASVFLADWWSRHAGARQGIGGGSGIDVIGAAACGAIDVAELSSGAIDADGCASALEQTRATDVSVFSASGLAYHEAGASQAQELGAAMATAIAVLKACEARGVEIERAARTIEIELAADCDLLLTIAKLRAARAVWARLGELCGFSAPARIAVQTSARMMSERDPETNMVRTTLAALGAGIGGADAITILPFTHALGRPDNLSRRIARNQAHVVADEARIGEVSDAAAGSWAIEDLTGAICEAAWATFQTLEGAGGIVAALASGSFQSQIAQTRAARAQAFSDGGKVVVGSTAFQSDAAPTISAEPWSAPAPAAEALRPMRLETPS